MKTSTTINASEVADFVYCQRSWYLRRLGTPVNAKTSGQQAVGIAWHRNESSLVTQATRRSVAGGGIVRIAIVALIIVVALYAIAHLVQ